MASTLYQLAKMIDHSVLHPTLTSIDLEKECAIALRYDVASVCVKPWMVKRAAEILGGSDVLTGTVIGFPAGNSTIAIKQFETEAACRDGAVEIDMVINIGKALEGDWDYIYTEMDKITASCHQNQAIVKVIFETDYITREQDLIRLCEIATSVKADYVKTSTGFGFVKGDNGLFSYQGATIPVLELMRKHSGPAVKIKAAGGVRTLDQLLAVRDAGCDRCGATATQTMLEEARSRFP